MEKPAIVTVTQAWPGTGQRYEDLEPFKAELLVNRILGQ